MSWQEDDERRFNEDAAARRQARYESGGGDPCGCLVVIVAGVVGVLVEVLRLIC